MTDVQLEHGFTRLANRLVEALCAADFTASQLKIVLALWRDTYGWQEEAVSLSVQQLADRCGAKPQSGGFRRALDELLREGVVIALVSRGQGQAGTYRVQKDYTLWGWFSPSEGRLVSVWDQRPEHVGVQKTPAKPAVPKKEKEKPPNYVARAVEIWSEERDGGVVDYGPVGQHLKPLVAALGEKEMLRRWRIYCRRTKGQTWGNPAHFKANHGEYQTDGKNGSDPLKGLAQRVWQVVRDNSLLNAHPQLARDRIAELEAANAVPPNVDLTELLRTVGRDKLAKMSAEHFAEAALFDALKNGAGIRKA